MGNFIFEKVKEDIYAVAIWDRSWQSFNNYYLVNRNNNLILIDSGKLEHIEVLQNVISQLGMDSLRLKTIFLTHGHSDHIGGAINYSHAKKFIHKNDFHLLNDDIKSHFIPIITNKNPIRGFECFHLGHHTKGSIGLFDRKTKILFSGDFFCFFGYKDSKQELVREGIKARSLFRKVVHDYFTKLDKNIEGNYKEFENGVRKLTSFNADYLCTGHGMVLKGEINKFLLSLLL